MRILPRPAPAPRRPPEKCENRSPRSRSSKENCPPPNCFSQSGGGAFLRILERLVGFADFLEFFLGAGLLGNVRMILPRELAVRLLDVLGARLAVDAHHRVVVFVFHPWS